MIGLGKWRSLLAALNKGRSTSSRYASTAEAEITFVSAADSSHFRSFTQLAKSFNVVYPCGQLHFFDMGLQESQLRQLQEHFPFVTVHKFDYSLYPAWMNIKSAAGNYGWKAQIVEEIMTASKSRFLAWMDAGNVIDAPLRNELSVAVHKGVFVALASETNEFWTHPSCIASMDSPKRDLRRLQISAAGIVFDLDRLEIRALIEEWAIKSRDLTYIAPPGSSRANHRQDQAILSLLLSRHMRLTRPIENYLGWHWPKDFSSFRIHQDID
jgi:hypothetical protein